MRWLEELYLICKSRNLVDAWAARWLAPLTAQVQYPAEALSRARPEQLHAIEGEAQAAMTVDIVARYGHYEWTTEHPELACCTGVLTVLKERA